MIAQDTGHRYVVEDEIEFSKIKLLREVIGAGDTVVIQCPFFLPIIHQLNFCVDLDYDESCVVMMHRYRRDIEASEEKAKRVNFKRLGFGQKRLYGEFSERHVSDVKYEAWEKQRDQIPNTLDVGYPSLSGHPLWVEDRTAFRFQHKIKQPEMPAGFKDGMAAIQACLETR